MPRSRTFSFSMLLLLAPVACDAEDAGEADSGAVDFGASGKADGGGALAVFGEFSTNLNDLPTSGEVEQPLRDSRDLPDLTHAADLYGQTFETGGAVRTWLDGAGVTEDDVYRAAMFASAHEHEVRDDAAVFAGVEWSSDDLRSAYALAWLFANDDLRLALGDGSEELNPALFHAAFTQLLDAGYTVVSGGRDTAGAVYDGFELTPEAIDRDRAEAILHHDVDDAAAYFKVAMEIPERFQVGDITVRAKFSPVDGESWDHELAVSLWHAPPGNGPSLVYFAGGDSDERPWQDQEAQWETSAFNFEGSESNASKWELRVCDVGSFGDDRDQITGYVDAFEIEFEAL